MSEEQDKPEPVRTSAATYVDPIQHEDRCDLAAQAYQPINTFAKSTGKSAIATQLDDLEECIADLKGEIGRLINEINPVLNPQMEDSTEAKREGVSEDEASEVARIIEYNRYQVIELTDLIRHTIDRLEI